MIVKIHFPGGDMNFKHRPALVVATKMTKSYEVATVAMITSTNSSEDDLAFPLILVRPDASECPCFITPRYLFTTRTSACAGSLGSVTPELLAKVRDAICRAVNGLA